MACKMKCPLGWISPKDQGAVVQSPRKTSSKTARRSLEIGSSPGGC